MWPLQSGVWKHYFGVAELPTLEEVMSREKMQKTSHYQIRDQGDGDGLAQRIEQSY